MRVLWVRRTVSQHDIVSRRKSENRFVVPDPVADMTMRGGSSRGAANPSHSALLAPGRDRARLGPL